ncbi:Phosphoenolpyruvate-protein phosphotransferase [Nymphon striatum]|nr:Phosphoenolpyruvate-protein phosphotransferase [Nymphon striatum]
MKPNDEPNPCPGVMRMQLQALLRAANGRNLTVMFPFVAQYEEYTQARAEMDKAIERETKLGYKLPATLEIGAMLETPSLAFAPQKFFEEVEFLSIGGNDLKQFFFAADRENERVRRRYDSLNVSFLSFLETIVARCEQTNTHLSFCGEDAGRPCRSAVFGRHWIAHLVDAPCFHWACQTSVDAHRSRRLASGDRKCAPERGPIGSPCSDGISTQVEVSRA